MRFLQQYFKKRKRKKQEIVELSSEFGGYIATSTEDGRIDDMTERINATVTHKTFGAGKITKLKNGTITIQFDTAEKKFLYPDAFKPLLIFDDSSLTKKINETIKITETNQTREEPKKTVEKAQRELAEKPETMNHTDLDGLEHMKIGTIAQIFLRNRLENGHVDPDEIELLQTKAYSREVFHIQYPLLLKPQNPSDNRPLRYYKKPVKIYGQYYYLCSEWFEVPENNDRPYLMKWLILRK